MHLAQPKGPSITQPKRARSKKDLKNYKFWGRPTYRAEIHQHRDGGRSPTWNCTVSGTSPHLMQLCLSHGRGWSTITSASNMRSNLKGVCKPRTTSHDCSAGMTNTSDYFRAQITHLYIHTTIHSYMRPYTTTTPCLQL